MVLSVEKKYASLNVTFMNSMEINHWNGYL